MVFLSSWVRRQLADLSTLPLDGYHSRFAYIYDAFPSLARYGILCFREWIAQEVSLSGDYFDASTTYPMPACRRHPRLLLPWRPIPSSPGRRGNQLRNVTPREYLRLCSGKRAKELLFDSTTTTIRLQYQILDERSFVLVLLHLLDFR